MPNSSMDAAENKHGPTLCGLESLDAGRLVRVACKATSNDALRFAGREFRIAVEHSSRAESCQFAPNAKDLGPMEDTMTRSSRRLASFTVSKLFGVFDHEIKLNVEERITLIHSPNGYGKTIILKMISGFFGGSLAVFGQNEYVKVSFRMSDGAVVEIVQGSAQRELIPSRTRSGRRPYEIIYHHAGATEQFTPGIARNVEDGRFNRANIERYIPNLARVGPEQWRDAAVGDIIDISTVMDRYGGELPYEVRRAGPHPAWLTELRESLHCRLIETQRLFSIEQSNQDYGRVRAALKPVVTTYAAELESSIAVLLANSARLSQSLDQTFPTRLLDRMHGGEVPPSEAEVRGRLAELEEMRARLADVDLLESAQATQRLSQYQFDDTTKTILDIYADDTEKKLSAFSGMLRKLEVFVEIINDKFIFKSISISRKSGFRILDQRGATISPDALSSGEQHELILLYDLLFKTRKDTLVLIDEPEISLHVAWQKRFLRDLKRIIELTELDALISTHSPIIVGSNLDLTVQLQPPIQ